MTRNRYSIAPGLYCVGWPDADSPVLASANYKLSFDALRKELKSIDAWIMVLDTRGVNVWCAAGKKTFSSEEVVRRAQITGLGRIVRHRELILPQLSAPGVSAHEVKKGCGFKVIWGPVRSKDLKSFLEAGKKADPTMREVTFTLKERLEVAPVEISHLIKPSLWVLPILFLISGVGGHLFSLNAAWSRGAMALAAYGAGILAGAIVAPAALPWIPGRAFSVKGAFTGLIAAMGIIYLYWHELGKLDTLAILLWTIVVSSYLAMNFTGSTPFTSPSGVEKEMRRAIPVQLCFLLGAAAAWVGSGFMQ
jgi:hypothetical protein